MDKQQIEGLRARWTEEAEFALLARMIAEAVEKNEKKFFSSNRKVLERQRVVAPKDLSRPEID